MTPPLPVRRFLVVACVSLAAACSDIPSTPITAPEGTASLSVTQGPDRLEAAFRRVTPEVMAIAGTVFADNDERVGRLVIGVENIDAVGAVRAAMTRLGVAESDFSVELTLPIHFAATLRDRIRPTQGGIQIHFTQFLCTMGFNVDHEGGRSFITNSHCTARQGATEGTLYYQPTKIVDPTVIAIEADDPPYFNFRAGDCPKGKKCRYSDAARARYADDVASNRGEIARTTGVNDLSREIAGVFSITSQDNLTTEFANGLIVNKVGRTTGWTRAPVDRTCVNTSVFGSPIHLLCQTWVTDPATPIVAGGDSGSPVFTIENDSDVKLIGILWGGTSDNRTFVFSPFAAIQRELGPVTATK